MLRLRRFRQIMISKVKIDRFIDCPKQYLTRIPFPLAIAARAAIVSSGGLLTAKYQSAVIIIIIMKESPTPICMSIICDDDVDRWMPLGGLI